MAKDKTFQYILFANIFLLFIAAIAISLSISSSKNAAEIPIFVSSSPYIRTSSGGGSLIVSSSDLHNETTTPAPENPTPSVTAVASSTAKSTNTPTSNPTITTGPTQTSTPSTTKYPAPQECTAIKDISYPPITLSELEGQQEVFVERILYNLYTVYGSTAGDIRNQLAKCSYLPPEKPGTRYYGATYVSIHYAYWTEFSEGTCKVSKFRIHNTTNFVLPTWGSSAVTPIEPGLVEKWQNYNTSIRIHEDGHRQHGITVSEQIRNLLQTFPTDPNCGTLEDNIESQVSALTNQLDGMGEKYDAETERGYTQLIRPNVLQD